MGKPTSLCMSDDSKWLVCGFEAGSVVLWDLATTSVVKKVAGVARERPSVTKVQFEKVTLVMCFIRPRSTCGLVLATANFSKQLQYLRMGMQYLR